MEVIEEKPDGNVYIEEKFLKKITKSKMGGSPAKKEMTINMKKNNDDRYEEEQEWAEVDEEKLSETFAVSGDIDSAEKVKRRDKVDIVETGKLILA